MPEPKLNREDLLEQQSISANNSQIGTDIVEHMTELRDRIFISLGIIILAILICFYFANHIIKFLEAAAPPGAGFFQIKPGELFLSTLKVSVTSGVVLSMPFWLKQIELFLRPGLKPHEIKIISPIVSASPLLFWSGTAFAYYLILPPLLQFLFGFGAGLVENRYGLEHFINLELAILTICGISFQLPIVIIVLGYCKIINSTMLFNQWRYVILAAFTLAAVITPTPDPFTMSILACALLSLYFGAAMILKLMLY